MKVFFTYKLWPLWCSQRENPLAFRIISSHLGNSSSHLTFFGSNLQIFSLRFFITTIVILLGHVFETDGYISCSKAIMQIIHARKNRGTNPWFMYLIISRTCLYHQFHNKQKRHPPARVQASVSTIMKRNSSIKNVSKIWHMSLKNSKFKKFGNANLSLHYECTSGMYYEH